ncbi:glycosyltransferase family 2 protein [Leptodesmis sp.]|uniref:glycosyltransferase family 2 protein n=1 Tax=Leptodesmis sp. TaxID=3100501 RepID=UPI004053506E
MSLSPVVSVLISVFNAERYLRPAIDSILNQSFQDFELLLLDDGSVDGSWKILQEYAGRDPRIRITRRENRGVPKSRNELLAMAKGEFVAVMDADDIALPDRLTHQVEFLHHHPEVVCVGGSYQLIDEAGRLLLSRFAVPETDAEVQAQLLAGFGGMHHPCLLIRRSAMLQVGGYTETMITGSDIDLCLKLGEVGQLVNLREPVLQYRVHSQSLTERNYTRPREEVRAACERAWKRRGITGEFKAVGPRRPGSDRQSQETYALLYGWWAFNSRQRGTAIHYGWRAVQLAPFNLKAWKLFACALLKPLPDAEEQTI